MTVYFPKEKKKKEKTKEINIYPGTISQWYSQSVVYEVMKTVNTIGAGHPTEENSPLEWK